MRWLTSLRKRFQTIPISSTKNRGLFIRFPWSGGWELCVERGDFYYSGNYMRAFWLDAFSYVKSICCQPRNALVLGQGVGSSFFAARQVFGNISLTGVDYDPAITALGRRFYSADFTQELEYDDMPQRGSGGIPRTVIADVRDYLKCTSENFDLIAIDLFVRQKAIPCIFESDFITAVRNRLRPGGYVIVNVYTPTEGQLHSWRQHFHPMSIRTSLYNKYLVGTRL